MSGVLSPAVLRNVAKYKVLQGSVQLPRMLLPRTWVNNPSRAMRQGSVCGMLGGVSRFLYPPRMKSWLQFAACGVSQI
jgi:hypothetical protein